MALIECPECTSRISDQAIACPRCGFPMAHSNMGLPTPRRSQADELQTKPRSGLTARKLWAIILFALTGAGAIFVIRHFVTIASMPGGLGRSPFDTISGTMDAILRLLFFVGVPFILGMGLWSGFRSRPQASAAPKQKVMLVGGKHFGRYIDVDPADDIVTLDGELYRRNAHDLFLYIG